MSLIAFGLAGLVGCAAPLQGERINDPATESVSQPSDRSAGFLATRELLTLRGSITVDRTCDYANVPLAATMEEVNIPDCVRPLPENVPTDISLCHPEAVSPDGTLFDGQRFVVVIEINSTTCRASLRWDCDGHPILRWSKMKFAEVPESFGQLAAETGTCSK
jgi:hypothetical protein